MLSLTNFLGVWMLNIAMRPENIAYKEIMPNNSANSKLGARKSEFPSYFKVVFCWLPR